MQLISSLLLCVLIATAQFAPSALSCCWDNACIITAEVVVETENCCCCAENSHANSYLDTESCPYLGLNQSQTYTQVQQYTADELIAASNPQYEIASISFQSIISIDEHEHVQDIEQPITLNHAQLDTLANLRTTRLLI